MTSFFLLFICNAYSPKFWEWLKLVCIRPPRSDFNETLPDSMKPLSYTLHITPAINYAGGVSEFKGSVVIEVSVTGGSRQILLHCRDLRISSVELTNQTGEKLSIVYKLKTSKDILVVDILGYRPPMTPFICKLTIRFSGQHRNERMSIGFFQTGSKSK